MAMGSYSCIVTKSVLLYLSLKYCIDTLILPMLPSIETLFTPVFLSSVEAVLDRHLEQETLCFPALLAIAALLKLFDGCVMALLAARRELSDVFHCVGVKLYPNLITCIRPVWVLILETRFNWRYRYRTDIPTIIWITALISTTSVCVLVLLSS